MPGEFLKQLRYDKEEKKEKLFMIRQSVFPSYLQCQQKPFVTNYTDLYIIRYN